MNGQAQIGRISGIPVIVDYSFILLVILWGYHYFTSGNLQAILLGLWIVGGVAASILIHELAHAYAARWYGVGTTHVELNGLGGLCHYDRLAPSSTARVVMALAGPASNLALWGLFLGVGYGIDNLSETAIGGDEGIYWFSSIAAVLAQTNFMLFWFNLLPSHPLDGGTALAAMMQGRLGYDRAMRVVAYMGMAVCLWLVIVSFGAIFAGLLAIYLFMNNQRVLETHGGGTRWT